MNTSRLPRLLAAVACVCGVAAWIRFLDADLFLSHYDAKAHLVVARRVIDSITPGWQQIGAVWLPLPHLIQILPTQVDLFYRTGAFASLLSVASFTVMVWAATRLVLTMTGSAIAAVTTVVDCGVTPCFDLNWSGGLEVPSSNLGAPMKKGPECGASSAEAGGWRR